MADLMRKHEIEAALAKEAKQVSSGKLKEDNPLDLSEDFRIFCEACRRGDLKVCQESISAGVNINARDKYDYTPLILVGTLPQFSFSFRVLSLPPDRVIAMLCIVSQW